MPEHVGLGDLYDFSINQDINVAIKVASISAPQTVTKANGKHLTKQYCIIMVMEKVLVVLSCRKKMSIVKEGCSYTLLVYTSLLRRGFSVRHKILKSLKLVILVRL